MKPSAFIERVNSLRERLREIKPDTLWIRRPENRRYLSGFKAEDSQLDESSGSLLINRRKALLITDSRYTVEAEREAPGFEVITLKKGLLDSLPTILSKMGTKELGFEEEYLIWGTHRQMAKKLRKLKRPIRLTPIKGVVEQMREIKEPGEVRVIRSSADKMSDILGEVIEGLKPGMTEREVAWQIEGLAREAGADGLAFPSIVASGPNGALPHAVPTNRKIRPKDPIILDVGIKIDGYSSDMSRTVFLDRPGPKFRKVYRTVREAQVAAMKEVFPGVESTYPDSVARRIIKEAGFGEYFGHALGHGVGLATHEAPRLGPHMPVTLEEGMVVTVEPGIYLPGRGGVRLEEMVLITKRGPKVLTRDQHIYDF